MNETNIKEKPWFDYLGHDLTELINESLHLQKNVARWEEKFHDYSFIVFPAAKAYEGFLKKLFYDLGFISKQDFYNKYFRIGKALNPDLERSIRARESVYDKLVYFCGGVDLADTLWGTWKSSRNSLFHWFPDEKTVINFEEAKENLELILSSIDKAFVSCKLSE